MDLIMGRIGDGFVRVWRWFDRVGGFLTAVYLAGGFCLWIAGSLRAGRVIGFEEVERLARQLLQWVMAGWR